MIDSAAPIGEEETGTFTIPLFPQTRMSEMRPRCYCGVLALVLMQSAAPHPYPSPPGERGRGEGERLSLANVPAPAPLVADEPLARAFSLERAAQALDTSALHWQKTPKCAACHTTRR